METEYRKRHEITYTEVNAEGKLDLVSSINLVQNMMTEYFENIKSDNIRLKKNNNAIWVVTKTKIHFNKYPMWREPVQGQSYTTKIKPIRIQLETAFKNKQKEVLFCTKQEACIIDLDTRKLRKINTVDYPENMTTKESIFEKPYARLKEEFSEKDFIYNQKIYSSDIDFSKHTNNVSYVKYLVNTLPCSFFEKNTITDFEIHYISESREGQNLKIYKKDKEDAIEFLITDGENEIVRAKCKLKK